jgi:hypothetical protein
MSNRQRDMAVLLIGGAASGRQEQIQCRPFQGAFAQKAGNRRLRPLAPPLSDDGHRIDL